MSVLVVTPVDKCLCLPMNEVYTTQRMNNESFKLSDNSEAIDEQGGVPLPIFLRDDNDTIYSGFKRDTDTTDEWMDYTRRLADKWNFDPDSLPTFLYRHDGSILMGSEDDSDVTEAWEDWISQLRAKK